MNSFALEELDDGAIFDCPLFTRAGYRVADPFTRLDKQSLELLERWAVKTIQAEGKPLTPEELRNYKNRAQRRLSGKGTIKKELFDWNDPVRQGIVQPAQGIRETQKVRARKFYDQSFEETRSILRPLSQGRVDQSDRIYDAFNPLFEVAWELPQVILFRIADSRESQGNEYIYRYSLHTALLSVILSEEMGLSETQARRVGVGGLVHDVGMLKIPQYLRKTSSDLTRKQYEMVQSHTEKGARILSEVQRLENSVKRVAAEHHEQVDGSGYPDQLTGDEIHQHARIVNMAMAFVAMTQQRSHRSAHGAQESIQRLLTEDRDRYDSRVREAFLKTIGQYPPGTFIQLESGHHALVLEPEAGHPGQPVVKVITGPDQTRLSRPFTVHLSDYDQSIKGLLDKEDWDYSALELA